MISAATAENVSKSADSKRYLLRRRNSSLTVKTAKAAVTAANVCPAKAISLEIQNDGKLYISKTRLNKTFFHAELGPGAENSGKLVAKVKNNAKKYARENNLETVLVDGSPGIGCPVISSLSGANYVVLVTEPTVSGAHDLKRVVELVQKFKIKMGCIINKADVNIQRLPKKLKPF
jgi:MinD superfamily P-loop ATPase